MEATPMSMTPKRDAFVKAYSEGALQFADPSTVVQSLVGMVYDLRQRCKSYDETIEKMEDLASCSTIRVRCRSCDESYEWEHALSDFDAQHSYCGRSDRCCP